MLMMSENVELNFHIDLSELLSISKSAYEAKQLLSNDSNTPILFYHTNFQTTLKR